MNTTEMHQSNAARLRGPCAATIASIITVLLILGMTASAYAQSRGGGGGGRGGRQRSQQSPTQSAPEGAPNPADSVPATPPASIDWPWLDAGTVLCASRDDLYKYQTQTSGSTGAEQPPACSMLLKKTGIQIVDHDGPSRTEVHTTDEAPETGWTNAFLPANAPPH